MKVTIQVSLHYGSKKCRRTTKGVMAAELLALVTGLDQTLPVKSFVEELLGKKLPLDAYTDLRTTFNCITKNACTLNKRIQMAAAAPHKSYSREEMRCPGWVPGTENSADGLTKSLLLKPDKPSQRWMMTNYLRANLEGWSKEK